MTVKRRLDDFLRLFPQQGFRDVVTYLEYLGVPIAFMAGSIAIMRYPEIALPAAPWVAGLIGVALLFGSFVVLVLAALWGWQRVLERRGYTWLNHGIGALLFFASLLLVIASAASAFKS